MKSRFPVQRHRWSLLPALCAALLAAGCGSEADTTPARAQGPGHGPPGAPGDRPAVPVAVAIVGRGDIASTYEATAALEAEKTAEVLARVDGRIVSIAAEEGDRIAAGGALLAIEDDEYRLRVEQAAAATADVLARFRRLEAMLAEDLASQEEYQTGLSELEAARAEEALARLTLSHAHVVAPFAGVVTQRLVDVGQTVSAGTPLFAIADFDPLLARIHVPSRAFNRLAPDQGVALALDSDGTRLQGRVKLISPVIDPASGTIKITVEVPDYPVGVRPGDFAKVSVVTELRSDRVLAPRAAVLGEQGETFVYAVVDDPQHPGRPLAERRLVETGFADDRYAEIIAGLAPGERIVVRGQRSLEHGTPLRILDAPETDAR
jgi:membrane fusion protein (multidrug efflux system)